MGFGSELQGQPSHSALLSLQDAELRLLESVKKCVNQRIKCDRDYATALANMVNTAQKLETSPEFNSPTFQAWSTVIKETENVIKLIRDNAEKLVAKTLERLVQVINEKKSEKKFYNEEHNRLHAEFCKVEETMNKYKSEYEKMVGKVSLDRAKYEDNFRKAKGGSKLEECRQRYLKSESKLQRAHNDYVCSLREVSLHQKHYVRTTLPELLDFQQTMQQSIITQSKEILEEYAQFTDHTSQEFMHSQQNMQKAIANIKPLIEYDDFLNKYRSDPLQLNKYEFDAGLLDDYKGSLLADELTLNDLTYESLQMNRSQQQDNLNNCQRRMENKIQELRELEQSLLQMGSEHTDEITRNSYNCKQRAVQILKREITELKCAEEKHQGLYDLIQGHFTALGEKDPPPGLDLPDAPEASTPTESESLAKKISDIRSTFSKASIFKRSPIQTNNMPPVPPIRDFMNSDPITEVNPTDLVSSHTNGQRPEANLAGGDGYQQYNFKEDNHLESRDTSEKRLDEEEWFHGVLPREEVQKMLQEDGDFLVRQSKNRRTGEMQYVLSVMWNGHKHFIIQGDEGSWKFEADAYPTIQELIVAQHQSNTPVTKKSEAVIKRPVMRSSWELNNDDIELCQKIGNGNFGEVFRGIYRNTEVAVKTCREALSDELKKKFLQEGQILMQYNHPNIVQFIGIAAQRQPVMIVMEYVPGGSLLNYLKKKGLKQQKKALVKMCEDAAAGMAYLEEKNCIHRDLAARNCLVDEKNNITKISDFGMSREDKEYTVSGGLKQIPIKWTAPEALNYGTYTSACDVWSFGILMWEVFAFGVIPYQGLTNTQAMERVDDGYRMPPPDGCPQAVYDLMLKCWDAEPKQRPLFSELHPELNRIRMASR